MPPAPRNDVSPMTNTLPATAGGANLLATMPPGARAETQDAATAIAHGSRADADISRRRPQPASATKPAATNKQSREYVLKTGFAGGMAAVVAKTAVGPLDRVKLLFQANSPKFAKYSGSWSGMFVALREINSKEGMRGLYRGHSATIARIFPYGGIKFLAYEQIRAALITGPAQETPGRRLASGSLSGVLSVLMTYPLEVVRVRMAFASHKEGRASLTQTCKQIWHEHAPMPTGAPNTVNIAGSGTAAAATLQATATAVDAVTPRAGLGNFYRGLSPTLLGMVPYAGMSFLTHDTMGDLLRLPSVAPYTTTKQLTPNGLPRLKNRAELAAGAMAGLVSQTVSYPLEIVRRRMQVGAVVGDGHRLRMLETAGMIVAERGWRGFFVGLSIGYIKIMPMTAISFWTYEKTKELLGI